MRNSFKQFRSFTLCTTVLATLLVIFPHIPLHGGKSVLSIVEPEKKSPNSYYFVLNDKNNNEVFGRSFEAFFNKHRELWVVAVFNNDRADVGQTAGYIVVTEPVEIRESTLWVQYENASDALGTNFEGILKRHPGMIFVNPKKLVRKGGHPETVGYFFVVEKTE